jgi:LuxR family maltose regulon positive regulatory protein
MSTEHVDGSGDRGDHPDAVLRFGQCERALHARVGRGTVPERVPCDAVQHPHLDLEIHVVEGRLACEHRRKRRDDDLDEPLTDRALAVLRFLPTNMSAPEIGREMYLSVHTVKTYMRRLYAKLDAHSRNEAVGRARDLGLLGMARR